jgi:hypothetical protein
MFLIILLFVRILFSAGDADEMGLGRAVETKRDALLRLLARLLLAVDLLSYAPFDGKMTRWVCRAVSSVLDRAELAAGYLVIVAARVLVAQGVTASEANWLALAREAVPARGAGRGDDILSCTHLRARLFAVRAVLNNLHRHALRLLRRCARVERAAPPVFPAKVHIAVNAIAPPCLRLVPRVARPPGVVRALG